MLQCHSSFTPCASATVHVLAVHAAPNAPGSGLLLPAAFVDVPYSITYSSGASAPSSRTSAALAAESSPKSSALASSSYAARARGASRRRARRRAASITPRRSCSQRSPVANVSIE